MRGNGETGGFRRDSHRDARVRDRPNRSAHDAIRAAQGYIQGGKTWVVDIDLKSFFDEVNHDRLMRLVGEKIRDKRLLRLIGNYLRAPMQEPDGSRNKRRKGTPQGGPLSPLLANIYLDELDKELEARGLSFVRYADDVAIFTSSERAAARVLEGVVSWIEKHLKVPVNREKSKSGPTDESALLGFRLYADGRINALKRLGVKGRALGIGYTGLGAWRVARLWAMQQALSNKTLKRYGLIIPWDFAEAHP